MSRAEERFGLTYDVLAKAHIGLWAIEIVEGEEPRMYANATMCELLAIPEGLAPEAVYHAWYDNVDPGSYDKVAEAVDRMIAGEHAEVQYPWKDRRKGNVYVRCGGLRNPSFTRGIRLEGCHQDVTELVRSQDRVARTELENKFLTTMLMAMPSPVFIKSAENSRYLMCNRLFADNIRRTPQDIAGVSDFDIFPEEFARMFVAHDADTLRQDGESVYFPCHQCGADGGRLWDKWQTAVRGEDDKRYIVGALWDVSEMKRAEAARSEFFANVSHDIRTPLNAIIGFSQLLQAGVDGEEERQKCLDGIIFSGETLLDLVNDVLDLSRLESGKFQFERTRCKVTELARNVVSATSVKVSGDAVRLYLAEPSAPVPEVEVDAKRIRQILFNLVGNALKFTTRGEVRVSVDFVRDDDRLGRLVLAVKDTGVGISEDDQKKIFDAFVQARSAVHHGTGLGLSICKRLAETMGGSIALESRLGEGSVFTVTLPGVRWFADAAVQSVSADQAAAPARNFAGLRILAVDDVAMNISVLRSMLKKIGVSAVTAATGGAEALALLRRDPGAFDLVLTDIRMPDMDGNELAREIRADPALAGLRVYAVTADVTILQAGDKALFDGMLLKPITLPGLRDFVEGVVK